MQKQSINKAKSKLTKHRRKAAIKAKRPVHKKFLLHPASVMVILLVGVLLAGWTYQSSAAEYTVTAKIPADPLTEPAVITAPVNGSRHSSQPITVAGTCPYKSYIKLYRNDVFAGTALCQPVGKFSLQVGLLIGENRLQAHVFNVTDEEGPLGSMVTVFYAPPIAPKSPVKPVPPIPVPAPFIISSDYRYRAYLPKEGIEWQLIISGGESPYAVNIKWGDGNESNYVQKDPGALTIEHSYLQTGTYRIEISGSDLAGTTSFLQLNAIVVPDPSALVAAPTEPSAPTSQSNLLWLMWPAYAILLLMVVSFWLGEWQEYVKLTKHQKHRRHRHA